MAIRFQCPACSQPIEVDDEWAQRAVACPYCRKTITAPAESTLGDLAAIPTASPLTNAGAVGAAPLPYEASNPLAVVATVLAAMTAGLIITVVLIFSRHSLEYADMMKEISALTQDQSPMQAAMEYTRKRGGMLPGWFMAISFLGFGSMITCVAGLICGLFALRRPVGRPLAVISVVICSGVVAWFGLGLILGLG